MYALIHNNRVVQISDNTFPVHNSLQWVECDDSVKPEDSYIDNKFQAYVRVLSQEEIQENIIRQLDIIDIKSIRALRNNETDRLLELESQAAALRAQL